LFSEGAKVIFSEKIIKILTGKSKSKLKTDQVGVVNKLRKQERLSANEFWGVYESIRQEGPVVKYQNPNNWFDQDE
jgi:hypothetical protein